MFFAGSFIGILASCSLFKTPCIHTSLTYRYVDERHGPTVLVLQSPAHLSNLQVIIPSLGDFPVVQEPANSRDNM